MINQDSLFKIFKASPVPTVILMPDTPEFTVVEANNAFLKKTKKSASEIIGKKSIAVFLESEISDFEKQLKSSLRKVMKSKEAEKVIIENVEIGESIPILSDTGEIEFIVQSYLNNTFGNIFCGDKNCLNEKNELQSSEEKYKKLFQLSPMPKLVYELETFKIFDVNEIAIQKYGYSREEFLTMKLEDLRAVDEVPKLYAAHKNLENKEGLINFGLFTHLKKDKSQMHVDVSGNRFSFKGKNCMMVVFMDVTERENALRLLQDNQQKLLTAQNFAKIGYWKLDLKNQQLFWSEGVYKILGLSKERFKSQF